MTDDGLLRAEVEVMLIEIQRNNEAMGQAVARIADDQRQAVEPLLQDIIDRQAIALAALPSKR